MSFWIMVFSGCMSKSGVAGSYGSSGFSFLGKLHTLLHRGHTKLHSTNSARGSLFSIPSLAFTVCRFFWWWPFWLGYIKGSKSSYRCLVAKSCPTLCDPKGCSPPGSTVHGISQVRLLECVAIPFSRGSSQPRAWTWVSCTACRFFTVWATRKPNIPIINHKPYWIQL